MQKKKVSRFEYAIAQAAAKNGTVNIEEYEQHKQSFHMVIQFLLSLKLRIWLFINNLYIYEMNAIMTTKEYADLRGITIQAVNKAIQFNHNLPGVIKHWKSGRFTLLEVDKKKIKK